MTRKTLFIFLALFYIAALLFSIYSITYAIKLGVKVGSSDTVGLLVSPDREVAKRIENKYTPVTGLDVITVTPKPQPVSQPVKLCPNGSYNINTKDDPICRQEPTGCPYGDSLENYVCLKFETPDVKMQ